MALIDSFKGDFLGFTFNNQHSSDLRIVIVSGGNRFEKNLLPSPKDLTTDIPGNDGAYFFSSSYQAITFNIQFAYDDLREEDIRSIRQWLGTKKEHDLIFDEEPYKVYTAKTNGQPKLSYICFDSPDGSYRIYKGEGTIQFQCYYPLARTQFKTLDEYSLAEFPTKGQWALASGLLPSRTSPTIYDRFSGNTCRLYNPGDIGTPLSLPEFSVQNSTGYQSITQTQGGVQIGRMILDMTQLPGGLHYRINSKLKLIQGFDYTGGRYVLNNKVYNNAIAAGDFFIVEPNNGSVQQLVLSPTGGQKINIVRTNNFDVDYDYLYY